METNAERQNPVDLCAEQVAALQKAYELMVARVVSEYDQRDRDFTLHVTINAGLIAVVGFLVKDAAGFATPGLLVVALIVLSVVGIFVAYALYVSVRSFEYWQSLLNTILARLEQAILGKASSSYGFYSAVVARFPQSRRHLTICERQAFEKTQIPWPYKYELVNARKLLATLFLLVWFAVFLSGVIRLVWPSLFQWVSAM